MRVLVVKLTSMGDTLHLLPALSDLTKQFPDVIVDWMVEDSFSEIPGWHGNIDRTISVSTRRWRKLTRQNLSEFFSFIRILRKQRYDAVVDAQGLIKSAVLSRFAKLQPGGQRIGFSGKSIKETPAAKFYKLKVDVERQQHAIDRLRQLFATAFGYDLPSDEPSVEPDYDVQLAARSGAEPSNLAQQTVLFFPSTTWPSKHVPDAYWREILDLACDDGYRVKISWGNKQEKSRAQWIAQDNAHAEVLPKSSLTEMALLIKDCAGVIAVDTGLGHMAAALGVPAVSVYGATDARLTGAVGKDQVWLQSKYPCSPCLLKNCDKLTQQVTEPPCYQTISAAKIWQSLYQRIV